MTLTEQDWEDARDGIPLVGGGGVDWPMLGVIAMVVGVIFACILAVSHEPAHKVDANPHNGWVDIGNGQTMKCDGPNGLYYNVGIIINDPRCK